MSIFRNTFTKTVKDQLGVRQKALKDRTPKAIMQLNSRNSWVRMTSGVNVNGTNDLAKQYVMLGGVLNQNKTLKSGVGNNTKSYSNFSPSGNSYNPTSFKAGTAGIKPMPGITAIDIKSKSAYGSLREVTVQFECHNLQQLEDLELLYMRPGYTTLIEWGWTPFLNNKGELVSSIDFYDGVLNGGVERDQVFLDLFQRSQDHSGNYDALYGYVKNYNWTARMDGGYTCTTTIISIGEIMESLKVGWTPLDVSDIVLSKGLLGLNPPLSPSLTTIQAVGDVFLQDPLSKHYSKNILAGLCYELYTYCSSQFNSNESLLFISKNGYNMVALPKAPVNNNPGGIVEGNIQAYITLESFIDILNKHVLLAGGNSQATGKPFISLSTKSNAYEGNKVENLLCLAHPLQVSIDPTVCLITSPIWAGGINTSDVNAGSNNGSPINYETQALDIYYQLENIGLSSEDPIGKKVLEYIGYGTPGYSTNNAKEFLKAFANTVGKVEKIIPSNNASYIGSKFFKLSNNFGLDTDNSTYKLFNSPTTILEQIFKEEKQKAEEATKLANGDTSNFGVQYLKDLSVLGSNFQTGDEFGIIGNIYISIDFLYRLATNDNVKNNGELKLYKYLKTILTEIQECIGSVNNFDIHVDPVDSVARIIDVNYVDSSNRTKAYNDAFQLEMSNTSGTVRSYNMQSQIFPEQASIVSIGAQIGGGGAQASQNNTLLDFNNNLTDRIITKKFSPSKFPININTTEENIKILKTNLDKIKDYFLPQNDNLNIASEKSSGVTPTTSQSDTSEYKGTLRDIIRYFQGVTASNSKNRSIIPIKVSLTMDGIGGLVIGHLFKIPSDLLPKGYKEDSIGGKLLQTVIGISHKVGSGDWTTTIDAYNIISNDARGEAKFKDLISLNPSTGVTTIGATAEIALSNMQLSGDYLNRAADFIKSKENFEPVAKYDQNAYRLGYGTDKILDKGKLRNVVKGDTTTESDAEIVIQYQIKNDYEKRVIRSIGQSNWDKLNANQKAALISFAYNVGSVTAPIKKALDQNDYQAAANEIKNGPNTVDNGRTILKGLTIRREQEAILLQIPAVKPFSLAPIPNSFKTSFQSPNL